MTEQKQISKRLRYEVLRRDNHACRYCGATAPDVKLTIDHVVPVALGGSNEPSNLAAACMDCNGGKSSSSPDAPIVADVSADALRWSQAMQEAAKASRAALHLRIKRRAIFRDAVWGQWTYRYKLEDCTFDLPPDWEGTIDRFWDAGIEYDDWVEAVRISMTSRSRDPFRYMCGVLWRWVGERQEIAIQILSNEATADGS